MTTNDFAKYLSKFLSQYLPRKKNASANTISAYRDSFKIFLIFCETFKKLHIENINLSIINKELVIEFLDWIEKSRKCSIATRNHRLATLHAFFKYVQKESPENLLEIRRILDIPIKKVAKPMIPYLTANELKILLKQPNIKTKEGRRDLILLVLLYDTGARVQELIDLKWKNVRLKSPAVITLHGKGDKTRQVPIMGKTHNLLESYQLEQKSHYGIAESELSLFYNQQHKKLSRWGISYIINKYFEKAKTEENFCIDFAVTPHVFRQNVESLNMGSR